MHRVVLPGDGIGPEISRSTVEVLEVLNAELGLGLTFEEHEIGLARHARDGSTFPDLVLDRLRVRPEGRPGRQPLVALPLRRLRRGSRRHHGLPLLQGRIRR